MKRVLRSSTLQKREKELLDLNKEPDNDSSADYFSAEGNVVGNTATHPSECDLEADSSVCIINGRKGGKGESLGSLEGGDAKGSEATTKEGTCESQPLEYARDTSGVVNEGITSNTGTCTNGEPAGKKKRGRKRKTVEIPSSEGAVEKDSAKERFHLSSVQDGIEEKRSEAAENLKLVKSDTGGDLGANVAGNTNNDRQEFRNGRRGRKRTVMESVGDNNDNGVIDQKAEKLGLDGKPQVVGRLLRSRTMATNDGEKPACEKQNVGSVGLQVKRENDASEKKNIKLQTDGGACLSQKGGEAVKARRGRPPKLQGKIGNSKVIVSKEVKVESQKNSKLPEAENKVQDSKNSESSELLDNREENTTKHKKKRYEQSTKGHKSAEHHCQSRRTSERLDLGKITIRRTMNKSKHKKDGDLGRRGEQQLVRDEIVSLVKKVGWTIEYRPRNGREYNDAVYVDWEGKTYWSVTLAYRSLKEKVENGTADARAVSLFTPISEERLSTLLRVRKEKKEKRKKKQEVGNETGKPEDVSSRKKTKRDNCERSSSMVASRRGKPKSNKRAEIRKPVTLIARGSKNGLDPNGNGFELYEGKRNLLSWMIDRGTVPLGVKVKYMNQRKTNVMLEGKIGREGICCGCCDKILTILDFETHAGSKLGQPFNNIYLESGPSLLQCLTDTWRKKEEPDDIGFHLVDVNSGDPNDDTCNICGDGGDLICCDGCPSTFHQSCLQIQKFPSGDWHCVYCSCKFCGMVGQKAYQRDDRHDTDDSELLDCLLCEEKYHVSCIRENGAPHVNSKGLSFCGRACQKLFERLEKLLGVRHELEDGFSWTVIRHQDINKDTAHRSDSSEFEFNSNRSDSSKVEFNSKLAVAFSIMDECFLPIIDQRSKTSMIKSVIYSCGSNFRRLNYSGFYTCILERGDELVSAAAIRIHGNQLAEMPFIGTRYMYRRQGMCRRLLTAIETALASLEVEKLVIPAISELNETWTKVFGFLPLEESKRQEMKYMSMIVFPGTDMLQKPICKPRCGEGELSTAAGAELSQLSIEDMKHNNPGPDSGASEVGLQGHDDECAAVVGAGAVALDGSFKDGPDTTKGLQETVLEPVTSEADTSENPGDKLLSVTSPVKRSEALSNVNHEPAVAPEIPPHSYDSCSLSSNPDASCLSSPGNISTCVPEVTLVFTAI